MTKKTIAICLCEDIEQLEGNNAQRYCSNHLENIYADGETWQIFYKCPSKDISWVKEFSNSELHGGGSPRLRKLNS